MTQKLNVAIVGATGNVGREIIQILEERNFPVDNLYLLASSRSKGKFIKFKGEAGCREAGKLRQEGKDYIVQDGDIFNFLFNV